MENIAIINCENNVIGLTPTCEMWHSKTFKMVQKPKAKSHRNSVKYQLPCFCKGYETGPLYDVSSTMTEYLSNSLRIPKTHHPV